jgi:beta-1,4-mannooligosaccharide/beta-1,4-mannosyl-N-acetylglucosamine phosphorylase
MASKKAKIIGEPLVHVPWEDPPAGCMDAMWRYGRNPIIGRHPIPCAQAIYNSAVVPFGKGFIGVFRTEYKNRMPYLHLGRSADGLTWDIEPHRIRLQCDDPELGPMEYAYDPRVCKIEDMYYVTWCNGYHGPTIGVARTEDFKRFVQLENAYLPCNRNGVLFPRKIGGRFAMLNRPSDMGHTPFGDIFYSESPDMCFWGRHRFVMGRGSGGWWESTKVGAGPIPIETNEGWLLIYHGVLTSCNGYVYSIGAALLDIDEPWKVKYRAGSHLLTPEAEYETTGFVPNVCFPCAALCDAATGRIALYYGAADTYVAVAFTTVDRLIDFIKAESVRP